MTDMRAAIAPKSDQQNYDDFVAGITRTIKITKVTIGKHEQPIAIHFEGDSGKPWKPCKSMARVLVHCWGADANLYVGRSVTLYGDPNVVFGGSKVGGIRVSHLSHINEPVTIPLTTTRSIRKPFTVKPLMGSASTDTDRQRGADISPDTTLPAPTADDFIADMQAVPTLDGLKHKFSEAAKLFKDSPDFARIHAAKEKRKLELQGIPL